MFEPRIHIEKARLTHTPEVRDNNGNQYISLNIAVNPGYYNQSKQWQDGTTQFYTVQSNRTRDVQAWQQLTKGDTVTVTGQLEHRQYQTKQGEQRTAYNIRFATVSRCLEAPKQQQQAPTATAWGAPAQPVDPWGTEDMEF